MSLLIALGYEDFPDFGLIPLIVLLAKLRRISIPAFLDPQLLIQELQSFSAKYAAVRQHHRIVLHGACRVMRIWHTLGQFVKLGRANGTDWCACVGSHSQCVLRMTCWRFERAKAGGQGDLQ